VAPAERHLVVKRFEQGYNLVTHVGPPENSCRPAVDVLFRSVAEACGARALGVVLTGMGQDGLVGARLMRSAGADILVQDEASSVIWGMPGAIAKAGLAARVLPLADLASEIVLRVMRSQPRAARPPALGGPLRPTSVERSG
jgi:two-component system chemotaxis response regulator CheB